MLHLDEIRKAAFVDELNKIASATPDAAKVESDPKKGGHAAAFGAGIAGGLAGDLLLAPITAPINHLIMQGYGKAIGAVKKRFK